MGVKVTTDDLRKVRYCSGGTRRWFVAHGLNWSEFIAGGLDEQAFLDTGDALVEPLVEAARKRSEGTSDG